jgi:CheY-like chemotaxis protein
MNILIADDDPVSLHMLRSAVARWGFAATVVTDGVAAWNALCRPDGPRLAILDWMMPGLDGVEICRRARTLSDDRPPYLILLTARDATGDVIKGLEDGANDYVTKPFDPDELHARVRVGHRVVELQHRLAMNVRELRDALAQVKQLRGLLPICAWCHKVRDDKNYWQGVETYLCAHADIQLSHGICPDCLARQMEKLEAMQAAVKPAPGNRPSPASPTTRRG